MTTPRLSIVVPTHCRVDLLRSCLESIRVHRPAGTEVVVVDDASPDAGASKVARSFPGVDIVRLERQGGFAVAANSGIRASSGAIVEVLNDDTEVYAGWAEAALQAFEDPQVGAVAPLVLLGPDGSRIDSAGDDYDPGGFARKIGHGQRLGAADLKPRRVFGASAAAAFYRRTALDEVGPFAESFVSYFEDVDLACRLQRAGWQTLFEPRCRVLHHGGASHGRPRRQLIERQSRNEEWLFWRNTSGKMLVELLPRHAAVLAGKAWRRWNEGTLTPWLFGRLRAWAPRGTNV